MTIIKNPLDQDKKKKFSVDNILKNVNTVIPIVSAGGAAPAPTYEPISHWIGDERDNGSIPNEVAGKPVITHAAQMTQLHFDGHWAFGSTNWGLTAAFVDGIISDELSDYTMIAAFYTGAGYSALYNQRVLSAQNSDLVEIIDNIAYLKTDNTICFYNALGGHPNNSLPISAIGGAGGGIEMMLTMVFEDPDIKIYKDGVLQGTLDDGYVQGKLDAKFYFAAYYGGGNNSMREGFFAEFKIFNAVLPDDQRLTHENEMAAKYGIY